MFSLGRRERNGQKHRFPFAIVVHSRTAVTLGVCAEEYHEHARIWFEDLAFDDSVVLQSYPADKSSALEEADGEEPDCFVCAAIVVCAAVILMLRRV